MPFDDGSFDVVINRHGDFNSEELYRVLKPGGLFITQQVRAENDRELVELLCGSTELPFPDQYLNITAKRFSQTGFEIRRGRSASGRSDSMMWVRLADLAATRPISTEKVEQNWNKPGTKMGQKRYTL